MAPALRVAIRQLDDELGLPGYAYPGDAGLDLRARASLRLDPGGGRAAVPTGVVLGLPEGYAGFVLPRSGLALHHGVSCLNSPGLIDSGYRDEVAVVLVNHDPERAFSVQKGDRIAQLLILPVPSIEWVPEAPLPEGGRGGGFGHSGI